MVLSLPHRRRGEYSSKQRQVQVLPRHDPPETIKGENDAKMKRRNIIWIYFAWIVSLVFLIISFLMMISWVVPTQFKRICPSLYPPFHHITKSSHHRQLPRVVNFSPRSSQSSTRTSSKYDKKQKRGKQTHEHHQHQQPKPITFTIEYPMISQDGLDVLQDSDDYDRHMAEGWISDQCESHYDWQTTLFPSCNLILEQDFMSQGRIVANGHWRDVWIMPDNGGEDNDPVVLKTMRYEHNVNGRNLDRHRRDAVAMERLAKSPWIMDMYGHCGNSGLFEYAPGGDLADHFEVQWSKQKSSSLEKLSLSTQLALAIADVHTVEDQPSMAHADISAKQWVKIKRKTTNAQGRISINNHDQDYAQDYYFKLNDFNRARFLPWNRTGQTPCPFQVGKNPGKNRSPEEYLYLPQTEKVDLFSLGNILYAILVERQVWAGVNTKEVQRRVSTGDLPPLPAALVPDIQKDPNLEAILHAMTMCHEFDPSKRANASRVAQVLQARLDEVDPGRLHRILATVRSPQTM